MTGAVSPVASGAGTRDRRRRDGVDGGEAAVGRGRSAAHSALELGWEACGALALAESMLRRLGLRAEAQQVASLSLRIEDHLAR